MKPWKISEAKTQTAKGQADTFLHLIDARGDAPPLREAADNTAPSGYVLRYWLAETMQDKLQGAAVLFRHPWRPSGVFSLQIGVVPEKRRQGIGSALFQEALTVASSLHAQRLLTEVNGSNAEALAFAIRHGFTLTQQFRTMVLDVAAFPFARFASLVEHVAAESGIHLFSFAEAGDIRCRIGAW